MAQLPDPYKTLPVELAKLREEVRQLRNRSPYTGTGLKPTAEGEMTVEGNLIVAGDFTAQGKISNDALVNPVVPQIVNELLVANFGLTAGTYTTLISVVLTPPEGATTGLVTLQGVVSALNTTATRDYQYASVVIGSSIGDGWATACEPSTYNPAIGPHSALVTGITGTLTVALKAQSSLNDWPPGSGKAKLTGSVLWLR